MNKNLLRNFVSQFGKEWECSCKEPFKVENLEVISETENSLIAHYVCQNCRVEQVLAASINEEKDMTVQNPQTFTLNSITSDDVLDIAEEVKGVKISSLRALYRTKTSKKVPVTAKQANQSQ